jgi:hypothetical protein
MTMVKILQVSTIGCQPKKVIKSVFWQMVVNDTYLFFNEMRLFGNQGQDK